MLPLTQQYEKLAVNPQDHLYYQLVSDISTMSLTVIEWVCRPQMGHLAFIIFNMKLFLQ